MAEPPYDLDWTRWERNFHAAEDGEYNGVPGTWRVLKQNALDPWQIWFRPEGMGPTGKRRKRGYWVADAGTLAAAKEKVAAMDRAGREAAR